MKAPGPSTSHPVTRVPQRDGDNLYATLHMHRVHHGTGGFTLVSDGNEPLDVPGGWQIADSNADDIRVCGTHPWQSWFLVFANGNAYGTAACNNPSLRGDRAVFVVQ